MRDVRINDMEEFLFQVLLCIAELVLELAGEALLDLAVRAIAHIAKDLEIAGRLPHLSPTACWARR